MDDPSNPFADPTIVRVKAQQTTQPNYAFSYNDTGIPTTNVHGVRKEQYNQPPPPQHTQTTQSGATEHTYNDNGPPRSNFPPIPSSWTWCPVKPCFYFNIAEEIPPNHQRLIKYQYYFVLGYVVLTFFNFIGAIVYLIIGYQSKVMQFLMALLVAPLFAILIFFFQYYVVYHACKLESANYYFWYLISTIAVVIILIVDIVGPTGSGWCGLIIVSHAFDSEKKSYAFGVYCLIISFGLLAVLGKFLHTAYRCRLLYMIAKHRQLSNEINSRQGRGLNISAPMPLPS